MLQKILIPLSGSDIDKLMLAYALYFGKKLDIPVVILSVVNTDHLQSSAAALLRESADSAVSHNIEILQEKLQDRLRQLGQPLEHEGLRVTYRVTTGAPAEKIIRVAEDEECSLIVLSRHNGNPLSQGALGSITTRVLHLSPLPILIIPPDDLDDYALSGPLLTKIIAPLSGTAEAETVLPHVEELAEKLALEVDLLHVIPGKETQLDELDATYLDESAETARRAEAETRRYLEEVADKLRSDGLGVEADYFIGNPNRIIVEHARRIPHSLVVMTGHERSLIARWLLSSTTEAVVRSTRNAILVIPRTSRKRYAAEVRKLLLQTPIFSVLPETDLESIVQAARIETYKSGEVIVKEGDTTGGLFIISEGQAEVITKAGTAEQTLLATLGSGEFFGEMSIIDDHPRTATVRAVTDTDCILIRRADFMAELERRPKIAVHMLPVLTRRLREVLAKTGSS